MTKPRIDRQDYIPMPSRGGVIVDIARDGSSSLNLVVTYNQKQGKYQVNVAVNGINKRGIKDALDLRVDNRE